MLQEFRKAFSNRHEYMKAKADKGVKIGGWSCTYVPEEIIHAAGMLPVRVFGWAGDTSKADGYLYTNVCSYARGCLEEGLEQGYDFLDAYVSANTCDNIRRLYEAWDRYLSSPFNHILKLPHKVTPASIAFFREELIHLKNRLEEFTGQEIRDEALLNAIQLYNQTRSLLKRLYELRKTAPPPISGAETLEVVLAALVMPKERYNRLLEGLLEDLSKQKREKDDRLRILVVGSELDNPEYLKIIEDQGAVVVTDDLCNGTRYFWDLVDTDGDPLEALARRYLTKAPCARMRPATERLNRIREMIKEFRIDGIIYEIVKFCDLYGEDYPIFRDTLRDMDIPILTLSREYALSGVGQMKTRIQAFFETIRA